MKTYKEFISQVNEAFISDLFKKAGSFIRGDKKKITEKVQRMIQVEKDFINQSDELNYHIFSAEFKKSPDSFSTPSIKQKSIMSKRALESLRISKNSEISLLANEISKICKNNPGLLSHYQKEKVLADAEIAKYAYEKAKKFKDYEYETEFYSQWQNLDSRAKKINTSSYEYSNREDLDFDIDPDSDLDIASNLGIYSKGYDEFNNEINSIPKGEIEVLFKDARRLKMDLQAKLEEYTLAIRSLRSSLWKKDPVVVQDSKEKYEKIKLALQGAILVMNSKISILKTKLKIK